MKVAKKIGWFGVVLFLTGCVRLHKDGDGVHPVFRAWHPVTWLLLLLAVLPCAILGEKLSLVVPLRLSAFWQTNADQLQWVAPWTDWNSLKPFRFAQVKHATQD